MAPTPIDSLHDDFMEIVKVLEKHGEISLQNTTQENFRKSLLLSTASYFETKLTNEIILFFEKTSDNKLLGSEFVKHSAVYRQYHTFFDWKAYNANHFFSLFGEDFKKFMLSEIRKDIKLEKGVSAFMAIGSERNRLVHENYVVFPLEKTTEEIFNLYLDALYFVDGFTKKLQEYVSEK